MLGAWGSLTVDVTATFASAPIEPGTRKMWVRAQDAQGNWGPASSLTVRFNGEGALGVGDETPKIAFLAQNAPNPSSGSTTIVFGLPRPGAITLAVFDTQGRLVKRLADGPFTAGVHRARWDGRDANGARLGAGMYFYRLTTPERRIERRMALVQ